MSVTVSLYQNYSDSFVVKKSKTLISTVTCELTEKTRRRSARANHPAAWALVRVEHHVFGDVLLRRRRQEH